MVYSPVSVDILQLKKYHRLTCSSVSLDNSYGNVNNGMKKLPYLYGLI